ncbi:MAG: acetate--CoA ligase [Thermoplasmata archaeon]
MGREIASMFREERVFPPPRALRNEAHVRGLEEYEQLYRDSVETPEAFWARQAEETLEWFRKWDEVLWYDFERVGEFQGPFVRYFAGGKLNATYNCLDRHLREGRGTKPAIIWQGEREEDRRTFTYEQLYEEVTKLANILKGRGVRRGDTVTIYLPMIPELAIAMLACARIGAIHSVVFSAFSADSLRNRILDGHSTFLITTDGYTRAGKVIRPRDSAEVALEGCPDVRHVLVVRRLGLDVPFQEGRDLWWDDEMASDRAVGECPPEEMDAEDPLFILYTSGSTGKPKGVLHTTGGYMVYVTLTAKLVFDLRDEDVYWCTADIGWITGHSYIVYGPLSLGATVLMFEGVPTYPQPDRFWKIVEDYGVTVFYTAPTAIRALMRQGDEWANKHDLSSLRVLGTVGEPINPEAWMWYYEVIGKERSPIMDTWWQTETGGILITPLPGAIPTKPGSASKPFFGVEPQILRSDGTPAEVNEGGALVITKPWPGMIRGVYGDPKNERVREVYFERFPGTFYTSDGCRLDEDGFYWLMGRIDDVLNVSGHRLATAEVESALVSHDSVVEAAVVGYPHEVKGQGIYAYVVLREGVEPSDALRKDLVGTVRHDIGPIASPDKIQFCDDLPKTRSGKIMRRILRKMTGGQLDDIGDTSTLADASVVERLIRELEAT